MSLLISLLFLLSPSAEAESCERLDPTAFAPCDLFLGYGRTGESCEAVSGCSFVDDLGVDYADWIFPDYGSCTTTCTPGITLHRPEPGTVGVPSALVVEGAPAGKLVAVLYGFSFGETPVPGCAMELVDVDDPSLVGWATTDDSGTATVTAVFPPRSAGRDVLFQAVAPDSCEVSNLVPHTVP